VSNREGMMSSEEKPYRGLRVEVTPGRVLRLICGARVIALRTRKELETVGNQCLDLAVTLADSERKRTGDDQG
jgi:hypothetical protein